MWRNFRCLYICHVVKFEITQYVEKFQISPHLSYIEILNFSTRQIFLHISHMWEMWQISGMHLSNPPQPFYQSHVSFTPGLELFSSFLCSPIPCEESVTLWNCLIYIYIYPTHLSHSNLPLILYQQNIHILDICHFFYTHTFKGLKILHSKARKFTTKKASRQNSVNLWHKLPRCKIV